MHKKISLLIIYLVLTFTAFAQVNIKINAEDEGKEISPYIYGKNNSTSHNPKSPTSPEQWTRIKDAGVTMLRESEGNNSTKYNWRKKLLSAPDWFNQVSPCDWDYEALELQKNYPQAQGMWSFQLLGKVASSADHNFDAWSFHLQHNLPWPPVSVHQNLAGGGIPNTEPGATKALKDGNPDLYLQDWPPDSSVAILDHWFGENGLGLDKSKIRYWCMDNEPEIWKSTHNDIQPPLTADQYIANYIRTAKLAREKFPDIKLVGPTACNEWFWYASWGNTNPKIWLEYFIKRIAEEEKASGVRLLDVLSIHFYPGSTDPEKLVQMHRIYFDKEYEFPEASGVALVNGGWDPSIKKEYIFERCRTWLNKYFGPDHGITFGVTETGIKKVDPSVTAVWYASNIGEFMRHEVEVFTPWSWREGMWEVLHLFSRYNKNMYVDAVSTNEELISAYPTINNAGDTMVVVMVNRSLNQTINTSVEVDNFIFADQDFKMLTLSDLPDQETFFNHYVNALKTSYVKANGKLIEVALEPMSVSTIILVRKEKPTVTEGIIKNESPATIDLQFNVPILEPLIKDGFSVIANSTDQINIAGIERNSLDHSILHLTLAHSITNTDNILISYSGNSVFSTDSLGMDAFDNFPVQNLLDGSAPLLLSVSTNDSISLLLTFNKKMSIASALDFKVMSDSEIAIDSARFAMNDSTLLQFFIAQKLGYKDLLTIYYTGTTMMSVDGGILSPLQMMVQNTLLPPSPELLSASVTNFGYSVTLEFDLPMFHSFSQKEFFTIKRNQKTLDIGKLETIGNKIIVSLKKAINSGDTLTVSYSGGQLESLEGGKVDDFLDFPVSNLLPSYTLFVIPGKVEAEEYAASFGVRTETTGDVGGGQNVGYIDSKDWMEYAINVPADGLYTIRLRVASQSSKGEIILQLPEDDYKNIGTIALPTTGGWQKWVNRASVIELTRGIHRLRLHANKGGFNLNWFSLESGNTLVIPVLQQAIVTEDGKNIELSYDVELTNAVAAVPGEYVIKAGAATVQASSAKYDVDRKKVLLTLSKIISKDDFPIKLSYTGNTLLGEDGTLVPQFNDIMVENRSIITTTMETQLNSEISIFPSPATESIQFISPVKVVRIQIVNSIGKIVASEVFNAERGLVSLDASIPAGFYLMILETKNGFAVKRFVRQR
jgi:hypothetical protein